MKENSEKPVKIFWTGGWDSTFRLLQLIFMKEQIVQPYYIIDSERLSTRNELKSMKDIKKIYSIGILY